MWFKNLLIYRITSDELEPSKLEGALSEYVLQDCLQLEMQSRGWMKPKESLDQFVHQYNQHLLVAFGMEKTVACCGDKPIRQRQGRGNGAAPGV